MRYLYILVIAVFISGCGAKDGRIKSVIEDSDARYLIYVSKKNFTLRVYDSDAEVVANYIIGYGRNPDRKAKLYEGDNRTPEGVYFIDGIYSMDADKNTHSYQRLAALNRVYFRASAGFHKFGDESVDLGDNAYGPRFFSIDYPDNEDRKRYRKAVEEGSVPLRGGKIAGIGSGIAIHGNNDEPGIGELSSSGCIRLYNRDIVELDRYIEEGTPVIITSDWD